MSHGHHHSRGHPHAHNDLAHLHPHTEISRREYYYYCLLFPISIVAAFGEFLIALLFAHSSSAQADAIHAITHITLYGLALLVSRNIHKRRMDAQTAHAYRGKFLVLYMLLVFLGLGWIIYVSLIKLISSETVVSAYMLLSVGIGLCGNIIALIILNAIAKIHGDAIYHHAAHRWLNLDAWGDFAFSVGILIIAGIGILFPTFPTHIVDSVFSLIVVVWIGWSGIQILYKR